jgi:hypothetical protein
MHSSLRRTVLLAALVAPAAVTVGADPQSAAPSVAYVQATISEPDPSGRSLGFVTASGRARVAPVAAAARGRLGSLRPGDEVILTLEGSAERPVITGVKVSRLTPGAPVAEAGAPAGAPAPPAMIPGSSRPSWPNPYSRLNPGLPMAPARGRAALARRAGTLSVMPASLTTPVGPAPAQAVVAQAVLATAPAPPAARADVSSGVDALRARGARDFEAAVSRWASEARAVDAVYARYESSCPDAAGGGDGSRAWFGLSDGGAVSCSDAGCSALLDEIKRLGAPIKAGMVAAQEAARTAWVLPGTVTDIRRRHSMEWSGWDR